MSYDEYLNEWNYRQVTQYGGECVAGVAEYEAENNLPIVWGNAYEWINNSVMLSAYDWIDNNPNDPNQVPNRGDIIIHNGQLSGSGGYGHIAFYDMQLDNHMFQSFGQNWGGRAMHFQAVAWAHVAGWYHIKQQVPVPPPAPDPLPPNPDPLPPTEYHPPAIPIDPKLIVINKQTHKWGLTYDNFNAINAYPIRDVLLGEKITVTARCDHPSGYSYYLENIALYEGYNTLDCNDFIPVPYKAPEGAVTVNSPLYDVTIIKDIPGYETMSDAIAKRNPTDIVIPERIYYKLTTKNGMDCLMVVPKGGATVWINPSENMPDPTPEKIAKTTQEDIKKQWQEVYDKVHGVAEPIITAIDNALPHPSDETADNSWKATTPFLGVGGVRKPIAFEVMQNYQVSDLDGKTDKKIQLLNGQSLFIGGTFKKDGIKYFRPQQAMTSGSWWGIPLVDKQGNEIIQIKNEVIRIMNDDPDYIQTPAKRYNMAEGLADVKIMLEKTERIFPRVFDIFVRRNRKHKK